MFYLMLLVCAAVLYTFMLEKKTEGVVHGYAYTSFTNKVRALCVRANMYEGMVYQHDESAMHFAARISHVHGGDRWQAYAALLDYSIEHDDLLTVQHDDAMMHNKAAEKGNARRNKVARKVRTHEDSFDEWGMMRMQWAAAQRQ